MKTLGEVVKEKFDDVFTNYYSAVDITLEDWQAIAEAVAAAERTANAKISRDIGTADGFESGLGERIACLIEKRNDAAIRARGKL